MDVPPMKLERPIVFFDLETTGIDVVKDRIVEISCVKIHPDGNRDSFTRRVNPLIPIPKEATKVHGISDIDVLSQPPFAELTETIAAFFMDADIGGYNVLNFDLPFLTEEFLRNDHDFPHPEIKVVDVMKIYHERERRDLSAALRFYCGREHINAHSAEADAVATADIFFSQIQVYPDLGDIDAIHKRYNKNKYVDFAGRLQKDRDGDLVFAFGKHTGKKVKDNLDYATWMLSQDFAEETKRHVRKIVDDKRTGLFGF